MISGVIVPAFRTVVGRHFTFTGDCLQLPPKFQLVNETRLREGVETLEEIRRSRQVVALHDPNTIPLIKENLNVDVYSFRFDDVAITGVLVAMRSELLRRVELIEPEKKIVVDKQEEILMLKLCAQERVSSAVNKRNASANLVAGQFKLTHYR